MDEAFMRKQSWALNCMVVCQRRRYYLLAQAGLDANSVRFNINPLSPDSTQYTTFMLSRRTTNWSARSAITQWCCLTEQ